MRFQELPQLRGGGDHLHRVAAAELGAGLDSQQLGAGEVAPPLFGQPVGHQTVALPPGGIGGLLRREIVTAVPTPVVLGAIRQVVDVVLARAGLRLEDQVARLALDAHRHHVAHHAPIGGVNDNALALWVAVTPAPGQVQPHGLGGRFHPYPGAMAAQTLLPGLRGNAVGNTLGTHAGTSIGKHSRHRGGDEERAESHGGYLSAVQSGTGSPEPFPSWFGGRRSIFLAGGARARLAASLFPGGRGFPCHGPLDGQESGVRWAN